MRKISTLFFVSLFLLAFTAKSQNDITRAILYHDENQTPMPDVQVELYDMEGTLLATTFTNEEGEYTFSDVPAGLYEIVPSYDAEPFPPSLGDAFLVMMDVLGFTELDEIETLAGDVDGSGSLTMADVTYIISNIMFNTPIPLDENWLFEEIVVDTEAKEGDDDNDYGVSVADVGGTWEPIENAGDFIPASYQTISVTTYGKQVVSVTTNENLQCNAAGLVIRYPAEFIEVNQVTSPFENAMINVENGVISLSFVSETMEGMAFNAGDALLTFEVSPIVKTDNPIRFHLAQSSHFADNEGMEFKNASLTLPEISLKQVPFEVGGIYPNPVSSQATIDMNLGSAQNIQIQMMDVSGKVIGQIANRYFNEGNHQVTFEKGSHPAGIYLLTFQTGEKTYYQKVVFKD
jgi:5-hydroxyisourate hydrolase-like protein (transthyretin family)